MFGHCPYASIIHKHPELCKMDTALLRHALEAGVEQLARIDRNTAATQCIFALGSLAGSGHEESGSER